MYYGSINDSVLLLRMTIFLKFIKIMYASSIAFLRHCQLDSLTMKLRYDNLYLPFNVKFCCIPGKNKKELLNLLKSLKNIRYVVVL